MSDYARLQEENAVLKQQLADKAAGTTTAAGAKSAPDADKLLAVLQDLAENDHTKGDMKEMAARAIAAHRRHAAADARRNVEPAAAG